MDQVVKQYFTKLQSPQKEILEKVRQTIQKSAPQAKERMSYGVPAFVLKGGSIMYAAFKTHIGLYPEPATIEAFNKELKNYETAKGTIKFPLDEPIPYNLIAKIIKYKNKQER
ncbi:MAG: DUF1801 domain-containing protein [Patescibacteria group bacterium]